MIWSFVSGALAASPALDLALATGVEGKVTYQTATAGSNELVPFSKVRQGDVLRLPEGGSVQLMYFDDGHTETFVGPLELVVGKGGQPTARAEGDALVGEALRSLPSLMRRAELDKGGHTLVRGAEVAVVPLDAVEQAEVDAAIARYQGLRKGAAAEDILPEMYLTTVYLAFGQEPQAVGVLRDAVERCATCPTPKALLAALDHDVP